MDHASEQKVTQNGRNGHIHSVYTQGCNASELEKHCLKRQCNQNCGKGTPSENQANDPVEDKVNARRTDGNVD